MRNILLWGMGEDYEKLINLIKFEELKGNMHVVGIICREKDRYCLKKDGYDIFLKDDITNLCFDFIVITSSRYYKEIEKEILDLGIGQQKVIDGSVFYLPLFDFGKYAQLKENPVTILSDDCWGGYVYHRLKLPFTSPLINIYWDKDQFAYFMRKPKFYLDTELQMVSEGDIRKGLTPVASLGRGNDKVLLNFVHSLTFEDAKKQWERRITRINWDNIFVKFGLLSNVDSELKEISQEAFDNCEYKKIFAFYGDDIRGSYETERFIWSEKNNKNVKYIHFVDYFRNFYAYDIDVLKLLVDGRGFRRNS